MYPGSAALASKSTAQFWTARTRLRIVSKKGEDFKWATQVEQQTSEKKKGASRRISIRTQRHVTGGHGRG